MKTWKLTFLKTELIVKHHFDASMIFIALSSISPFPHFESLHSISPSEPPSSHAPPQLSNCGEDGAMRCNYYNWLWLLHLHDKYTAVLGTNGLLSAPYTTTLVWSSQDPAPVGLRGWLWGEIDGDKGALALDTQEIFCCSETLDTPGPMKVNISWKYFCPYSSQTRPLFTFEFLPKKKPKNLSTFSPLLQKWAFLTVTFFNSRRQLRVHILKS